MTREEIERHAAEAEAMASELRAAGLYSAAYLASMLAIELRERAAGLQKI